MNIQTEKLDLIKWIASVNEPDVIKKFVALKKEQETDWWDEISEEEKNDINEGLSQAEKEQTYPHAEVMSKYLERV